MMLLQARRSRHVSSSSSAAGGIAADGGDATQVSQYYHPSTGLEPKVGQLRRTEIRQADDSIRVIEQIYRISPTTRRPEWAKNTPRGTLDKRVVILAIKEEYANFKAEGVTRLQIRNMHYKMMERPELKLGEMADPYNSLDKTITAARRHEVGLTKEEKERGEPEDKYWIPDEWWNDLKRYNPEPRPFRTPYQFAKWIDQYHVRGWVNSYDDVQPKWFRQDKHYVEIWTEKDTMIGLLEQLVANVLGEGQITINSVSGNDSRSHGIKQIKRLLKHKKRDRKIVIFYFGDYDPSGHMIQENVETMMQELGLVKEVDYTLKRVGITLTQIKRLHLKEVTDPAKLEALSKDPNGPAFEKMPGHNGRRFAVEVDALSSGAGLKELKRIINDIKKKYWDEKTWKLYEPEFTSEKAKIRVAAELVPFIREVIEESDNPNQTIEEWLATLESEEDELRRIEGNTDLIVVRAGMKPLDPWDDDDNDDG